MVTRWVEGVFILDRKEGLAVSLKFHLGLVAIFSFLWQIGHWSCLTLLYITSSFGWVHHVSNVLPFLIRSFWISPLLFLLPEWSVQPFVAVPWDEPISVYSHIGVQFPVDSDIFLYEGVDMCGLLEVLFDTLLYALTN